LRRPHRQPICSSGWLAPSVVVFLSRCRTETDRATPNHPGPS
jgi:hypothetical protein